MLTWFSELSGWQQFGVVYGVVLFISAVVLCVLVARAPTLEWHD